MSRHNKSCRKPGKLKEIIPLLEHHSMLKSSVLLVQLCIRRWQSMRFKTLLLQATQQLRSSVPFGSKINIPSTLRHYYRGDILPKVEDVTESFLDDGISQINTEIAKIEDRLADNEHRKDLTSGLTKNKITLRVVCWPVNSKCHIDGSRTACESK